jgi:hypothetical protein
MEMHESHFNLRHVMPLFSLGLTQQQHLDFISHIDLVPFELIVDLLVSSMPFVGFA